MVDPKREAGYTLLELVVAVALITLMAAPLAGSFRLGLRAWQGTHETVSQSERIMLVRERLRTWMGAAYGADWDRTGNPDFYPLEGEKEEISFIAPIHPDARSDDMHRLTLRLEGDGTVSLSAIPDFQTASGETGESITLFDNVSALAIGYMDSSGNWQETWATRTQMPKALRLDMTFADTGVNWPELVVALKTQDWADCVPRSDSSAQYCEAGEHHE